MAKTGFPLDLNCDLGEGLDNDALLMPFLGSCNIACGGHCGDDDSIMKTLLIAKKFGVNVGAHPSYPDKVNFGRAWMDFPRNKLKITLLSQIECFQKHCQKLDIAMHHIKPHGALYNHSAKDEETANLMVELIKNYFPDSLLYCPPQSKIEALAMEKGIGYRLEVFADRSYQDDLSLLPRHLPGALITDTESVLAHVNNIINHQKIRTVSGKLIPIRADTLCIHGDNPNAYKLLKAIVKEYKA